MAAQLKSPVWLDAVQVVIGVPLWVVGWLARAVWLGFTIGWRS